MKIGPRQKFLLKFTVSFGLVGYLASVLNWGQVWDAFARSRFELILAGWLMALVIFYLQAWRWKILLHIPELPIGKYLHFIFIGIFYRVILPGSLSADLVKVALFGKKYDKPLHETSLVLFSQFIGMIFQWVLGIIGMFYFGPQLLKGMLGAEISGRKLALMGTAVVVLVVSVAFISAVRGFLARSLQAMRAAVQTPGVLRGVIATTLGIQIFMLASAYFIFWGAGARIPLLFLCFQMAIMNTLLVLPISINGIGVVEYLNLFLIQKTLGIPAPQIIAVSVASYALLAVNASIGGGWMLWRSIAGPRPEKP